jgi:hypothetical protein
MKKTIIICLIFIGIISAFPSFNSYYNTEFQKYDNPIRKAIANIYCSTGFAGDISTDIPENRNKLCKSKWHYFSSLTEYKYHIISTKLTHLILHETIIKDKKYYIGICQSSGVFGSVIAPTHLFAIEKSLVKIQTINTNGNTGLMSISFNVHSDVTDIGLNMEKYLSSGTTNKLKIFIFKRKKIKFNVLFTLPKNTIIKKVK